MNLFPKKKKYHNYIIDNLNTITDKKLFLCYTNSASLNVINFPTEQVKTIPTYNGLRNRIVFDVHPYPPSYLLMEYYKTISSLMNNISIFIGEFNAGIKKGVLINERQINYYLKRLKDFSIYWRSIVGMVLYSWIIIILRSI